MGDTAEAQALKTGINSSETMSETFTPTPEIMVLWKNL